MHELIVTPWSKIFFAELRCAKEEVLLVSPFIKLGIAAKIRATVFGLQTRIRTITRFKSVDFAAGASDIDAVFALSPLSGSQCFDIRYDNLLHAKMFIIDRKAAFVGSSNLTFSGLTRNYEACVRSTDPAFIERVALEFGELWGSGKGLDADAFGAMYELTRKTTVPIELREPEHFLQSAETPRDVFTIHSLDVEQSPSTELNGNELIDATQFATTVASLSETSHFIGATRDRIELEKLHCDAIHAFLTKIQGIIGIVSYDEAALIAQAVVPLSVKNYWSPRDANRIEDPSIAQTVAMSYNEHFVHLGKAVFELSLGIAAERAGTLRRYGVEGASTLIAACKKAELPTSGWHRAFLGPLLAMAAEDLGPFAYQDATYRLLGAVTKVRGLAYAAEVVAEFWNPFDVLGTDAMSVIEYKDVKTRVQEASLAQTGRLPVYGNYASTGESHKQLWSCTLTIGNLCLSGEGDSKKGAERDAATRMHREMQSRPGWAKVLSSLVDRQLDAWQKDAAEMASPRRGALDGRPAASALKLMLGANFYPDPDYVVLALIDPLTRRQLRLPANNRGLAMLGALVANVVIGAVISEQEAHLRNTVGPAAQAGIYRGLATALDVARLRTSLGLAPLETERMALEAAQALMAAVLLGHGYSRTVELFSKTIGQLFNGVVSALLLSRARAPIIDRIAALPPAYDRNVPYANMLQEFSLAFGGSLPQYRFPQEGDGTKSDFLAVVELFGFTGSGRAFGKTEARGRAAFMLLTQNSAALLRHAKAHLIDASDEGTGDVVQHG